MIRLPLNLQQGLVDVLFQQDNTDPLACLWLFEQYLSTQREVSSLWVKTVWP